MVKGDLCEMPADSTAEVEFLITILPTGIGRSALTVKKITRYVVEVGIDEPRAVLIPNLGLGVAPLSGAVIYFIQAPF